MGYNRTDTNRTGTLWDTIGLILIGLNIMGYNRTDTNRTEHYGIGHNGINTNRSGISWDGTQ